MNLYRQKVKQCHYFLKVLRELKVFVLSAMHILSKFISGRTEKFMKILFLVKSNILINIAT